MRSAALRRGHAVSQHMQRQHAAVERSPACQWIRCDCSRGLLTSSLLLLAALLATAPAPCVAPRPQPEEERLIADVVRLESRLRIFHDDNLLTPDEVEHLKKRAAPRIMRSGVVDAATGGSTFSDIRTSSGMFFARAEDAVISAIEARIADWIMVPAFNGEGIQVLKYEHGQKYDSHVDTFFHASGIDNGGNRLVTVLMYLTDVEEGGETVFPNVPVPESQTAEHYSKCAMQGLAVKPRAGSAVAFWGLQTDGRMDPGSLHGGCPVVKGVKWSATKWVHVARYAVGGEQAVRVEHVVHVPPPPPAPPGCGDTDSKCDQWAEEGECKSNPGFMVGTKQQPGACLFSCARCDLGPNVTPGGTAPALPDDDSHFGEMRKH